MNIPIQTFLELYIGNSKCISGVSSFFILIAVSSERLSSMNTISLINTSFCWGFWKKYWNSLLFFSSKKKIYAIFVLKRISIFSWIILFNLEIFVIWEIFFWRFCIFILSFPSHESLRKILKKNLYVILKIIITNIPSIIWYVSSIFQ